MKKLYFLALLMMVFISCSKENSSPSSPNDPNNPGDTTVVNKPKDTIYVQHVFDTSGIPKLNVTRVDVRYASISDDKDSGYVVKKTYNSLAAASQFFVTGDTAIFFKKYGLCADVLIDGNWVNCSGCILIYHPDWDQFIPHPARKNVLNWWFSI